MLWFVGPSAFDGVGVAGALGVDESEAVELFTVDIVGVLAGDPGDLLFCNKGYV